MMLHTDRPNIDTTTADDLIVNLISKGLSHTALSQLDKHSDEHVLQRVSSSVVDACSQTENVLRTDVLELIRRWFATDHEQIISPLFITISEKGIVYCTDDYHRQVCYYRQTSIPRKIYVVSTGEFKNDESKVPNSERQYLQHE